MKTAFLITILILLSNEGYADSIRCGRALVKEGDSSNVLIKKCGQPARKFGSKETVKRDGRQVRVSVSNWIYERYGKKDMVVSVRNATVVKVRVDRSS